MKIEIKNKRSRLVMFLLLLLVFNMLRLLLNNSRGLNDDYSLAYTPKGYELLKSINEERTFGRTIIHDYENEDGSFITLQISIYEDTWDSEIETNGEEDSFTHNGQEYFETKNYDLNQVYWHKGKTVYVLFGDTSIEELKKIIKKNL